MNACCWSVSILDFANPVEKKIGKSPCFKRNYTLFGNKSGEGAKQINKFEICEIVGKCYDEKLKEGKENKEYKGRKIDILYIFNIYKIYLNIYFYRVT